MKIEDLKSKVIHTDVLKAYEIDKRQIIEVPNPFDMQSRTGICHMEHFEDWKSKWEKSGFADDFTIESENKDFFGTNTIVRSNCPAYLQKRKEFTNNFNPNNW